MFVSSIYTFVNKNGLQNEVKGIVPQDLNQGNKCGTYIYLVARRTNDPTEAITDWSFSSTKKPRHRGIGKSGWAPMDYDLNKGCNGGIIKLQLPLGQA